MPDTWAMIDNFKSTLQPFYNQVDKTRKRLNLTPFRMKDPVTKAEMDDVIIVTENQSSSYMKRVIAGLMSAKWQGVVEGRITSREAHKIEEFNEACLGQADEYLFQKYGIPGLDVWLDNHACHTCLLGVQWSSSIEDGEYKVHCLPVDMRFTPFVLNRWVAPITYRNKEDLLEELERYEKLAKDDEGYEYSPIAERLKDTDNEIRDFWNSEKNELWINKELVFKQRNTYGKLNFVIVWVPSGYYFRDQGYIEHEAPSIVAINEGMYEQRSRQLTENATLAFNALNPGMEYETENPSEDQVSRVRPKRGQDVEVPKGELHRAVPTGEINRAELTSGNEVNKMIEDANPIAPRSYNTPPSAIEVTTEVELLDQLQNPQIIALQAFKSQLVKLNIEQVILMAGEEGSILAGRTGKQINFSVRDLKDPKKYAINYQLMKQNKRLAIINEARALAAWGKFPKKYILRDIVGAEDPDGWMREMDLEQAKAANPAIGLGEQAVRYAEEAEDLEGDEKDLKNWQSMMLVHDYVMLMRQKMQPTLPGEEQNLREATKDTGTSQGLTALLGQSAAGALKAGQQMPAVAGKGVTS